MKIVVAAIQMRSELLELAANLEVADDFLRESHRAGAQLAVLPEMFNSGYGLIPDFGPCAERLDGPTLHSLSSRSHEWGMGIAAGFVECDGRHIYDSLALCLPDRSIHIYRKRHLVFWESFRFRAGKAPLVVVTPWGRIGLAICADMIDRRVWDGYRGRIDVALIAAAWPQFACRHSGRRHCLLGHVGPMAATIPTGVARDLDVAVIFANQTGMTHTTIPVLGLTVAINIADRFAGHSSICDGRAGSAEIAGAGPQLLLSLVTLPDRKSHCA